MTKRIFVVDDHGVVRLGVVALLSQQPGFTVVGQAASAEEALPMITELKPDLVIMDVRLPGKSGIEACREVKAACPGTEVIVLSSFAEPQTISAAFMAGAKGYVLKDLENHRLLQAIQTVAAGGTALDPSLGAALAQGMQAMMQEKQSPPQPETTTLTKQEAAILKLVAKGLTNREIGDALFLSDKTVRNYLSEFMHRHNLHNRAEAATFAVQKGLLKDA
ncbi:MAG TPA: response regulator transcription factor [Symbiobacteriaceae bacterium]|jgi:two-component system, NarL family, response regulator DevR|nr:response regulator transcription factor [Symbiobacteriaceae bacterium]